MKILPSWLRDHQLREGVSVEVMDWHGKSLFSASGPWVYPLFEVEIFLHTSSLDPSNLVIHDKIVGQAAAALTIRMGFTVAKATLMSELAANLYTIHRIQYLFTTQVERISCITESLITHHMSLDEIYLMLSLRAKRSG